MRIVIVTNGASGRGSAGAVATQAAARLQADGHTVEQTSLAPGWADRIGDAGLIVACGGDGTLSAVASEASRRGIAVYHLPRGTENLFAREFGMRASAAMLADSVRAWNVRPFDLGCVLTDPHADIGAARRFALMCSVGFDADVLHALAARRRGPISHGSYVVPVARSLLQPIIRTLSIKVDGRVVVDRLRGNVVVSNCRMYALGINPTRDASMTDGALDVFFAPSASSTRTLLWMASALALRGVRSTKVARARGRHVVVHVEGDEHMSYQSDGEALTLSASNTIGFTVAPEQLSVLMPGRPCSI